MALIAALLFLAGGLHCMGEGSPTVMIVGTGFSFDWQLVQTEASKFTRVCTWDPVELTCDERINELHRLKPSPPLILVGLSAGAELARQYAANYPAEVAGMVIVDHAFDPAIPIPKPTSPDQPTLIDQTPIVFTAEDEPGFNKLPQYIQQLHHWTAPRTPPRCNPPNTLGAMPLAVISTTNDTPGYAALQSSLLQLSPNSHQFIAAHSFHSIEISEPDIVVKAIRLIYLKVTHAEATRTRP